jgi:enoyl-CoA hydratase/carnithine racemase
MPSAKCASARNYIEEVKLPFKTILYEVDADHVATITINRPEAMNSFNVLMVEEFRQLWSNIAQDDNVHSVVLRAAECRAFSPGADVRETGESHFSPSITAVDPGVGLSPKLNSCWKPVVTAVHGICAGGAFYWLNESDIIICSPDAEFFDPHVTYGLTAALEPIGLRFRVPLGDVLRMVLLGNDERITAETALRIGLVSEVVEKSGLWERAQQLAAKIAEKPPQAVQGSIRAIWESMDMGRSVSLQTALKYCQVTYLTHTAEQVDRNVIMARAKQFERR